ncbi:hypothetical protein ANCCAN_16661 [Ancylostoma caninum]|uniref:Uncharacterized protein n=1 Tax=Ancylostoma caninum TaxID=29170 RepID=A0A368FZ39_ANCCA|nr:hypothetical protein ANCCAN_16661 [Ancylostoma caninum]
MQDLDSMHLPDYSSLMTALQQLSSKIDSILPLLERLELDNELLLERTGKIMALTAPKSNCVFCPVEENRDSHYSSRCCKYADPVSRTVQDGKLGLCLKCLKSSHGDDCRVACVGCGLGHNQLLCNSKRPHFASKRPRN